MAGNGSLNRAKDARQDEFYTRLADIEDELRHYRRHFRGKTVLCNCDDPYESNFFKYFCLNFNKLGLRKLIATSYSGSPIAGTKLSLFDEAPEEHGRVPYKAVVTCVRDADGDGDVDMLDVAELLRTGENSVERLEGDGDFRSAECVALLDEADVVCTNPPFSLFREYVAQLVEHKKDFLVIGNKNALKYKEIFPLIQANRMWIGCRSMNQDFWLEVPEGQDYEKEEDGRRLKHIMACWYTNLDVKKRHEEMVLVPRFDPARYPRYANYDAIEVSRVADIPCDYAGEMGVPITFMDSYNPEQFEIVGLGHGNLGVEMGLVPYDRALKKRNKALRDGDLFYMQGDYPKVPYTRIVVRNLHPEEPRQ